MQFSVICAKQKTDLLLDCSDAHSSIIVVLQLYPLYILFPVMVSLKKLWEL